MEPQLLKGKRALITGGTRGIGKAIAEKFAQEGASLVLFGMNPTRGEEVVSYLKTIASDSQVISFMPVDVASHKQVEEAMAKLLQESTPIDILVNNAGITKDNLLMRITEDDWDGVLATNLKSIFNTCRSLVRPMMKARSGKIINITSVVGIVGNAGQTNYAASKAGMIGFTKSLAKEVGKRNIQVNCIAPGFIQTDMTEGLPDAVKQGYTNQIAMNRFGKPEEIANGALFLASKLSDYITGQVLTIDGGWVM